jgi:hypothetical protein
MKNTTLLVIALACTNSFWAQITFEYEHLPDADWSYSVHGYNYPGTDPDMIESFLTPASDQEQEWDLVNYFSTDSVNSDSETYEEPFDHPTFEYFPEATMGNYYGEVTEVEPGDYTTQHSGNYWQKTDSGLFVLGDIYQYIDDFPSISWYYALHSYSRFSGNIVLPAGISMGAMLTYEGITINESTTEQDFGDGLITTGVKSASHQDIHLECDAWGIMKTPAYPEGVEVLRVKRYLDSYSVDSTFSYELVGIDEYGWQFTGSTETESAYSYLSYLFLQADPENPIVATMYPSESELYVTYTSEGVFNTNVRKNEMLSVKLYPNPTKNAQLNITLPKTEVSQLRILDLTGRILHTQNVLSTDRVELNTHSFPNSLLLIQLMDEIGGVVATGKFVNQK